MLVFDNKTNQNFPPELQMDNFLLCICQQEIWNITMHS